MNKRLRDNLFYIFIMIISVSLYGCNSNSSSGDESAATEQTELSDGTSQSATTGQSEDVLFGDLSAKEIDVLTMTKPEGGFPW